jgi:tRNA A-37 threonylcarbamoyl transferase component Bud32/PAS domain-containing protein
MPASRPPGESDVDLGEVIEREGHETLLPSVQRSVLSAKSMVAGDFLPDHTDVRDLPQTDDSWDGRGSKQGAKPNDMIGGRYIVEGQLGRGGMGRVLRVRHQALGKPFALKIIKSRIASNPKIREMFYREARLASALTHDNICSIVDFGQDDQFGLFMVMELLDGQTVHAKLKAGGKLSPRIACDVMWQVADAVRFIHSRTILHGDIKTENIFLVKTTMARRLVKLLDFGLARPDLGRTEGMDGTPEYIAPERIDGAPSSQASDIYALGIVLFELLTGRLPFQGHLKDVLRAHKETPVPKPSTLVETPLDEAADKLVARATAKNPADRHPDVASFMYELRALMTMLGMDAGGARRRAMAPDGARERRDLDHRVKASAEVFNYVAIPMAACDPNGKVRVANTAMLEFLGCAGNSVGLELRDSALPEVYPTLFEDLAEVADKRLPVKRVIYLNEGGDRVVEAAIVLRPAPSSAEVTAGEIMIVLHPLRAMMT